MKKNLPTISFTLRKWLLLGTLTAFVLTTAATITIQYRAAVKDAERLLRLTIRDVALDIQEASDDNLEKLTRRIATAYESGDYGSLEHLRRLYNVGEINVIDAEGIIIETTEPRFLNYDMRSGEQSAEFLALLEGTTELVQPLQPVSYDEETLRKYAGITLPGGGFIQVGYSAEQFQDDLAEEIQGITANRHVLETGLVFILDANTQLVSLRGDLPGTQLRQFFSEGNKLGAPNEMILMSRNGQQGYWMYDTLEGYSIVAVMARDEALASVQGNFVSTVLAGVVLFVILYLGIVLLVKRTVVRPVDEVADKLSAITGGDLDLRLNVETSQEFARISGGINDTVDALKGYIAREAARIDEELAYARRIQAAALPVLSDAFTKGSAFRLFTSMDTAKEVGGDFYDFYLLDEHTLAFLIADVSGKGIPAAMFMMTGKTTLRDCVENIDGVGNAMARANDRLCEGNEAGMFITAWMGLMDLDTGAVRFANAGHNPPVLIRNGRAEFLDMEVDLILGVMDDGEYETQDLALQKGDLLFLYTDGVTEATNAALELYGDGRLLETLNGVTPEGDDVCQAVCRRVKASVDAFADGAPQADDITMLCLCYWG